jgi:transposase
MGNLRGVRRDCEALEQRRLSAVEMFLQELNNSEIDRRLKVSNQTSSRWRKELLQGGIDALRSAPRRSR